jgi:hypothetical protein
MHILNNKHEYGSIKSTMTPIKTCRKGWYMNILENYYIQQFFQNGILIKVQQPGEQNILFKIMKPTTGLTHAHNSIPTDAT